MFRRNLERADDWSVEQKHGIVDKLKKLRIIIIRRKNYCIFI